LGDFFAIGSGHPGSDPRGFVESVAFFVDELVSYFQWKIAAFKNEFMLFKKVIFGKVMFFNKVLVLVEQAGSCRTMPNHHP
jgi:hypothetical protein